MMKDSNRTRTVADRLRDVVLALVVAATIGHLLSPVFAAWDKTKPANNSALVSSEIRSNWTSLDNAFGNIDAVPLAPPVAMSFQSTTPAQFYATPTYKPGGDSSLDATVSGIMTSSVDTTQRANSGTGLTDLSSYSLPANTLSANGKAIRCNAWGTFAANANAKTLTIKFGATSSQLLNGTPNNQAWRISFIVIRTGAATQKMIAESTNRGDGVTSISSSPAETLSGAVTIKTQGQSGTASSDILQESFFCEVIG